jgi:hypothetical protein
MKKMMVCGAAFLGFAATCSAYASNLHNVVVLTNSTVNMQAYYATCSDTGQAGVPVTTNQTATEFTISTVKDNDMSKTYHIQVQGFNGGPTVCTFKFQLVDEGDGFLKAEIKSIDNKYPSFGTTTDYCSSVKFSYTDNNSAGKIKITLSTKVK